MKFKKYVCFIFSIIISFSCYSVNVFAETEISETCGDSLIWSLDSNGTLIISGSGTMFDFDNAFHAPWYSSRDSILHVIIESGVTNIGASAFYDCTSLTSILIPDTVNSINNGAFGYCSCLKEIVIPNSVTTIGTMAFYYCSSLLSISIPDSVTTIKPGAFEKCENLISIEFGDGITDFNYSGLLGGLGNLFSLKEIKIKPSNSKLKSINGVLFNKDLTEIFYYPAAKNDSKYAIPSGVKRVFGYCFESRKNISSIVLPSGLKYIDNYAFSDCSSLKNIDIPSSVIKISSNAFNNTLIENVYYNGSLIDRSNIKIENNNNPLIHANWHYATDDNAKNETMSDIIKGNPSNKKQTCNYRSTITFYANVKNGNDIQWYINGKKAGKDKELTVKEMKDSFTLKVFVIAKDGKKTYDIEQITVKSSFIDKLIAFFVLLFDKDAYTYEQV